MAEEEYDWLQVQAEDMDTSIAWVIRRCIRQARQAAEA